MFYSYPQSIFSVQAATKKGCKVNFIISTAELIAPDGTVFPIYQENRLYYLCKSEVNSKRAESLQTWHRILGHCNIHNISKMEDVDCETCVLAKQPNTRNRNPDVRSIKLFELVHTDLCGPVEPTTKDGFKYAMVFTDDFSGCMFTYFLVQKSDATRATEKFPADISPYEKSKH